MKINVPSLIAGIFIAVSGSIFASSTTVPFVFSSGQKAKAAEINSNFSTLTGAIDSINGKILSIESGTGLNDKENLALVQINLPVDSNITVGGINYTIVQFEVPRFDTDETYLIKFPSAIDWSKNTGDARVSASEIHSTLDVSYFQTKSSVNGFDVYSYTESNYSNSIIPSNQGREVRADFIQSTGVGIIIGTTLVSIYTSDTTYKWHSDASKSGDASIVSPAYPPTNVAAERLAIKNNFRELLSYVVITKKL